MTNLARLPPLGLKAPPPGDDPAYLADVRRLPCCICAAFGSVGGGKVAAHHTICGRFGQRKSPDECAIPLCAGTIIKARTASTPANPHGWHATATTGITSQPRRTRLHD